ncbi:hypothetical protein SERLADRAFT_385749 [Serpula lacrymans var. lacrymans S7.9]|uniref:Uncharacterized protein n=1 Tax=Serpula lacrymans var. lacrymans (strain S7.9) TaxID=578457 RepID=F8NR75_SERL9|nr:uncharacterized protein SERLADRAFT_385749 [Serpula lacrymans var. lacrymans S7.9]EGO26722.1 hypothetical protein SERLADRAFT_385749 [Serpula lacrymans var. lacrymans S7.9]
MMDTITDDAPKQRVFHFGYSPTVNCAWKYLIPVNCRNTPRRQLGVPVLVPLAGIMTRLDSSAQPRINV